MEEASTPAQSLFKKIDNVGVVLSKRECDGSRISVHATEKRTSVAASSVKHEGLRASKRSRTTLFDRVSRSNVAFVSRLKKEPVVLKFHHGCVNSIQWNEAGTRLVTGSDDCKLAVWCAESRQYRRLHAVDTGHFRNIFSARFVPQSTDLHLVSVGMDGQVQLMHESMAPTTLGSYGHMVYKISFLPTSTSVFVTTHEDGCVRLFDVRTKKPEQQVLVRLRGRKSVSANSLAFCPADPHRFVLGGADPMLRLYDMRKAQSGGRQDERTKADTACVRRFCPQSLLSHVDSPPRFSSSFYITGVDFNAQNEVVANYSGEDVYVWNCDDSPSGAGAQHDAVVDYRQVFRGRRNQQTFLKEVAFLGDGEYVATGCDSGHLFIWHKRSEELVQLLKADDSVVNGIAPHPYLPTLATCGIDSEGKVWEVGDAPTFSAEYARKIDESNRQRPREDDSAVRVVSLQQLWELLAGLRSAARGGGGDESGDGSPFERGEDDEEETDDSLLTPEEKIQRSQDVRLEANEKYKQGLYAEALEQYQEAARLAAVASPSELGSESLRQSQLQCRVACAVNQAACYLKLERFDEAVKECSFVLDTLQPDNVKALFRRAQALIRLKQLESARADLARAQELAPEDPGIKQTLKELSRAEEREAKREQTSFARMFQ